MKRPAGVQPPRPDDGQLPHDRFLVVPAPQVLRFDASGIRAVLRRAPACGPGENPLQRVQVPTLAVVVHFGPRPINAPMMRMIDRPVQGQFLPVEAVQRVNVVAAGPGVLAIRFFDLGQQVPGGHGLIVITQDRFAIFLNQILACYLVLAHLHRCREGDCRQGQAHEPPADYPHRSHAVPPSNLCVNTSNKRQLPDGIPLLTAASSRSLFGL